MTHIQRIAIGCSGLVLLCGSVGAAVGGAAGALLGAVMGVAMAMIIVAVEL